MIIQDRSYQTEAVQSIYDYFATKQGNPVVAMPTGCHAAGHGILLHDGSVKKVEDIRVGEYLMGPDSLPRCVLALARGRQEMRKIIPNQGESFVVNKDHKLLMRVTRAGTADRDFPCNEKKDEVVTITQYEDASNWFKHRRKIQRCSVEFSEQKLPLDPYFIGLLLGDGSTVNGTFNLTSADFEIEDYFRTYVESLGLVFKKIPKHGTDAVTLKAVVLNNTRSTPNKVTEILRNLDIQEKRAYEKSIPFIYKTASVQQRLELLAGILDTDAHYSVRDNTFQYCSSSYQLAKDTLYLIRSLGFRGQILKRSTTCRDAYIINITGNLNQIPTKVARKKAAPSSKQKDCLVTGFKVEKLPEDNYYGFTLSGDHLYLDENFVVHHNTGKSVVIARFLQSVFHYYPNQKIMVLTHVKELIEQNHAKLMAIWPNAPAGIHSAGLKKRDVLNQIIFGGIASVAKKWAEFGFVNLILIDEAHLVSPSEETMYRSLIEGLKSINPHLKIIGFTATPWRLGQGRITEDGIFTDICFDITGLTAFNRLIAEGFLAPLIPKKTKMILDVDGVHMRGGEFIQGELQNAVDKEEITSVALREAMECGYDRRHWLIFCSGVDHAIHTADMLTMMGIPCGAVHSKMKDAERDQVIADFKSGKLRAVANNNVLTTGFDMPGIDLIIMLRPTASPVLWVQMLGRGTRPFECAEYKKENCLVLDFAGNTKRLGPINDPVIPRKKGTKGGEAPVKLCEACGMYNHASVRYCGGSPHPSPEGCGHEFPIMTKLKQEASTAELIKGDVPIVEIFKIDHITYSRHQKVGKPDAIKVSYYCGYQHFEDYVCLEHEGFASRKARMWWRERSEYPVPETTNAALGTTNLLKTPTHLRVWINKKYPEIMKYCFDGTAFGTVEASDADPGPAVQHYIKPTTTELTIPTIPQPIESDDIPF